MDMRLQESGKVVAMLRPPAAGIIKQFELDEKDADPSEIECAERLDDEADRLRETAEHITQELRMKLDFYDYLPQTPDGVPSYRATKWIRSANVLVTIDPSDRQLSYVIACMRHNPFMAALLSYTDNRQIEERYRYMATQSVPLIGENEKSQTRIFAAPAARAHSAILQKAMRDALLYPMHPSDS